MEGHKGGEGGENVEGVIGGAVEGTGATAPGDATSGDVNPQV